MSRADTKAAARAAFFVATTLVATLPIACGPGGPEKASVSGKVTYQGKPVPKGTISFVPVSTTGRSATGAIQPDGSYTLQTETPRDGAQLGDYFVTISAHDEPILDYTPQKPVKPQLLAPAKYENPKTSDLKETVKSGSNTFNFDLKD